MYCVEAVNDKLSFSFSQYCFQTILFQCSVLIRKKVLKCPEYSCCLISCTCGMTHSLTTAEAFVLHPNHSLDDTLVLQYTLFAMRDIRLTPYK